MAGRGVSSGEAAMWKVSQRNSSSKLQHFQGYIAISVCITTVLSRRQAVPIRKSLAVGLYWLMTGAAYRSSDMATATFCSFDKPHRHCVVSYLYLDHHQKSCLCGKSHEFAMTFLTVVVWPVIGYVSCLGPHMIVVQI